MEGSFRSKSVQRAAKPTFSSLDISLAIHLYVFVPSATQTVSRDACNVKSNSQFLQTDYRQGIIFGNTLTFYLFKCGNRMKQAT